MFIILYIILIEVMCEMNDNIFTIYDDFDITLEFNLSKKQFLEDLLNLNLLKEINNDKLYQIKQNLLNEYKCKNVEIVPLRKVSLEHIYYRISLTYDLSSMSEISKIHKLCDKNILCNVCVTPKSKDDNIPFFGVLTIPTELLNIQKIKTQNGKNNYVNILSVLPSLPSIVVIRITYNADKKLDFVEEYKQGFFPLHIKIAKSNADIFRFNNYIISSNRNIKDNHASFISKNSQLRQLEEVLLFTSTGLLTDEDILFPWPFSSFQLPSESCSVYTLFLAKFELKEHDKSLIHTNPSDEIQGLNYQNELRKIAIKIQSFTIDNKKQDMKVEAYTLPSLSQELKKKKEVHGIFLARAFKDLKRERIFLLHIYDDIGNISSLSFDKTVFKTILQNIIKIYNSDNNEININELRQSMMKIIPKPELPQINYTSSLGDSLFKFNLQILLTYKRIYKFLYSKDLIPKKIIISDFIVD
jgi:hypothetical protein